MDKEELMRNLKTNLEQNPDIKAAQTAVNEYKAWMHTSAYKQGDTPVPLLFKLITLFFFGGSISLVVFTSVDFKTLSVFIIFAGFLFFVGWLLVPILKLAIRLNPNKNEYTAVVREVEDSLVSNTNRIPNKSLRLEIKETGETIIYETNGTKVPYDVGDYIDILVAGKTWIVK